ncbi:MAG: hypothetical protein ACLUFV_10580 [Acutalibacteraceae bacterium]
MKIRYVWEHNGNDTLLFAADFPGAYARGASRDEALAKLPDELRAFLRWTNTPVPAFDGAELVQEQESALQISDADSDVLFASEREPLTEAEYAALKAQVLRSAADFLTLYRSAPDENVSCLPVRQTFTARAAHRERNVRAYQNVTDSISGKSASPQTATAQSSNAGREASRRWSSSTASCAFPPGKEATANGGRCGRCCGAFSGTTESTRRRCTACCEARSRTQKSRTPFVSEPPYSVPALNGAGIRQYGKTTGVTWTPVVFLPESFGRRRFFCRRPSNATAYGPGPAPETDGKRQGQFDFLQAKQRTCAQTARTGPFF